MRYFLSVAFMVGIVAFSDPAAAQKAGTKEKDKKTSEEPTLTEFAGKSVEEWIKAIASRDRSKGEVAIQTVQNFGARSYEAIPALLAELEKHSPSAPIDISIRVNATMALGNIFNSFDDPQPKHVERAIKVLNRLLNDSQAIVRTQAALALGKLGPAAAPAIPSLLTTLRDRGTWETRQAAAMALGSVGQDTRKKVPSIDAIVGLGKALGIEPTSAVRLAIVQSLGRLGHGAATSHQKQLIQYLDPVSTTREAEPAVRIWAHMAVMSLANEFSESRLASIAKMLDYHDPLVRVQAAQALGSCGPKAKSAVLPLTSALKDKQTDVVMTSLWALGRMEGAAMSAVPAIKSVVADPKAPVPMKKLAEMVIDTIEGRTKDKSKDNTKDKTKDKGKSKTKTDD
ncbi:MAG: hypothetical protein FJ271_10575 [Planctomycetes bacterium]|nr:hypothetical protein [Planctomycetota bacterium]